MVDFSEQLPSLKKMKEDINSIKLLAFLGGKELRNKLKQQEKEFNQLVEGANNFNEYFYNMGWILHEYFDTKIMIKANEIYEKDGANEAEKILVDYYTDNDEINIHRLKVHPEFLQRFELIELAFEDHVNERYHASVPVFLIVIDGVVNDYTKRKGFFAEETDVSAWDCLVGANEGLDKLKNVFNQSRKKTNCESIEIPYRNGILHGRDINYNNAYVSCKCIALLFTICDWINNKKTEENRKEKYIKETTTPSINELIGQIRKNKSDKQRISEWKSKLIVVNKDIPESGDIEEYNDYKFVQPIIYMCKYWKEKNYGKLSLVLRNLYRYEQNEKIRPKLCREQFSNKEFKTFKIKEVEDRAISLKRVLVEVTWISNDNIRTVNLEFGSIYQDDNGKGMIPEYDGGNWVLMPWDISGLYSL